MTICYRRLLHTLVALSIPTLRFVLANPLRYPRILLINLTLRRRHIILRTLYRMRSRWTSTIIPLA